jgi:hypothetical protein
MSNIVIYPPDPDCTRCDGTGVFYTHNKHAMSIAHCDCRHPYNIEKIRERCSHEFVCSKCGTCRSDS